MPKYLCLQRSLPGSKSSGAKPSPSEMQALYAAFNAWREQFQQNLTDMGGRLGPGRLVSVKPPDGPFVELKELLGGYMIVTADSLEQATEVARACPGLVRPGSGVEVFEVLAP